MHSDLRTASLSGHMPVLDGVRGLAILMVLLFHFIVPTGTLDSVDRAISWLFAYGALGVDLFFILSGFLITGILYDSRSDPAYFRNFYMRRTLRIFPLYYAVLIIVFLVLPSFPAFQGTEITDLREHQIWAWLYGVNIYLAISGEWSLSYVQHFWSLAVEEHFYLFWPLVVWLLAGNRRLFLGVSLAIAIGSFGGRIVAAAAGVNDLAITVLTPFQLDALALGGFLAVYLRQPDFKQAAQRLVAPLAILAIALLLTQYAARHFFDAAGAIQWVRSGAFRLLLAAIFLKILISPDRSIIGLVFTSSPLRTLGKYSYGLYVYHHFFSYYCVSIGTDRYLEGILGSHALALVVQAGLGIAASMVVAWISFEFFEKHFLKLKKFWPSSRGPASVGRTVGSA